MFRKKGKMLSTTTRLYDEGFLQNNRKKGRENRPSSSEEYINCGKENLESLLGLFSIKYD